MNVNRRYLMLLVNRVTRSNGDFRILVKVVYLKIAFIKICRVLLNGSCLLNSRPSLALVILIHLEMFSL